MLVTSKPPPPMGATQASQGVAPATANDAGLLAQVVGVMIFSACATAGLKVGLRTSDAIILRQVYGAQRVAVEGLTIVKTKPHLVVSNGDVLEDHGFIHFLIVVPFFLGIGAGATIGGLYALPRPIREMFNRDAKRGRENGVGCVSMVVFVILGVTLSVGQSIWPNVVIVALAIACAWVGHARAKA
jgi:hypothetical protein